MTGKEIVDWIKKNHAENDEIYVEVRPKLFKPSEEFEVLGSEDCPCWDMIVLK
jgi:hypothetical protein